MQLQVGLGDRAYPIIIAEGLLSGVGEDIAERGIAKRFGVISDSRVAGLYGDQLMDSLSQAGMNAELITFRHGEENKNLATFAQLISVLAAKGFDRKDGLIALGGGVIGDITGFLASSYMRGIPFVQIPTTLLAQVDSSVGGKTGVDIPEGKNLVGAFYQPQCVYIDSQVLQSLPMSELLNGLAEVIKYAVIYDNGFYQYLEQNRQAILDLQIGVVEKMIIRCCSIKAEVVEKDEKESDLRRILNFGHTIGHAVEAASSFAIPHGSAIAMGMVAVAKIAVQKNLLDQSEEQHLTKLIDAYGLPIHIPSELDREEIKGYLKTDKKTIGGRPFFVLPTEIGKVIITDEVNSEMIDQVL